MIRKILLTIICLNFIITPLNAISSEIDIEIENIASHNFPKIEAIIRVRINNQPVENLTPGSLRIWETKENEKGEVVTNKIKNFKFYRQSKSIYFINYTAIKLKGVYAEKRELSIEIKHNGSTAKSSQSYVAIPNRSKVRNDVLYAMSNEVKADNLIRNGKKLVKEKNFVAAKERYEEAVKIHPDYMPVIEALQQWEKELKKEKDYLMDKYNNECRKIVSLYEIALCQQTIENISALEPSQKDIQEFKVRELKKLGVSENRFKKFQQGVELFNKGKYSEAKTIFQSIDSTDLPEIDDYIKKCEIYELFNNAENLCKDKNYREAKKLYEKVLAFNPGHKASIKGLQLCNKHLSEELTRKAKNALKSKKSSSAERYLNQALRLTPDDKNINNLMAETRKNKKHTNIMLVVVILLALMFIMIAGVYFIFIRKGGIRFRPASRMSAKVNPTLYDLHSKKTANGKKSSDKIQQLSLTATNGPYKGQTFFTTNTDTFIGSDDTNDISFTKDKYVSRRHAKISLVAGEYVVVDFKTVNGTLVNGNIITSPVPVKSGDVIDVGKTKLTVKLY